MGIEPTLSDVIRDAIEARLVDVHTLKVGKVVSYDADLQVVDAQPVMQRPYNIGGGNVDYEELPIIPNVPVVWPRAGGFYLHMPLKEGDFVVLGFTDDNIAEWRQSGELMPLEIVGRHQLGSAIAFVGINPALGFLSIDPLDAILRSLGLCFGEDGTDRQVSFSNDGITIGRPDPTRKRVSFVALADRTEARIAALEAALATVTASHIALTATVAALATALAAPPPDAPPDPFVANPLPVAADILKGTGPNL